MGKEESTYVRFPKNHQSLPDDVISKRETIPFYNRMYIEKTVPKCLIECLTNLGFNFVAQLQDIQVYLSERL